MTTTPQDIEDARRGWSERWSPLGGLAFAIGIIVLLALNPDSGETPQDVIRQADEKHDQFVAMAIFALVAIPLLLWFFSGLHARVSRLQSRSAPALVLTGGTAFTLLFFVAIETFAAPFVEFPGEADPTAAANAFLMIDDVAWTTLGGAGVAFALMAVAASIAALKSRAVPTWLGWLGAIVGLLSAATITFFGIFAWIAWTLVVSVLLLVRRA